MDNLYICRDRNYSRSWMREEERDYKAGKMTAREKIDLRKRRTRDTESRYEKSMLGALRRIETPNGYLKYGVLPEGTMVDPRMQEEEADFDGASVKKVGVGTSVIYRYKFRTTH